MKLEPGVVLVPRETPHGPAAARIAWADELGQLLVITRVVDHGHGLDVNCPTDGRTYARKTSDVLAEYEPAVTEGPSSWAAFLTRAATAAAAVPDEGERDARYWIQVARAVTLVHAEEFPTRAAALDAAGSAAA